MENKLSGKYRLGRRESDNALCLYTTKYNVVIAEFAKGSEVDAERIWAALEAYDSQEWIPTAERVPEACEVALVTSGGVVTVAYRLDPSGVWYDSGGAIQPPLAWQPLPEPYTTTKEGSDGE